MSARLILHIVTTLVLLAVGCWLYMRMEENAYDSIDSVNVAIYWFVSLVYVLFSWIFYWLVHRLKLKAWVIAQILAIIIAAGATAALLYVSREHQQQLEQKTMLQDEEAAASQQESTQVSEDGSETKLEVGAEDELEVLNLSEEGDLEPDQAVE